MTEHEVRIVRTCDTPWYEAWEARCTCGWVSAPESTKKVTRVHEALHLGTFSLEGWGIPRRDRAEVEEELVAVMSGYLQGRGHRLGWRETD